MAEQIEVGPSIHLPLDTLEFIHLALRLSIAVFGRQSGSDRIIVAVDPRDKAFEFRDATLLDFLEPSRKNAYLSLRYHRPKILHELVGAA